MRASIKLLAAVTLLLEASHAITLLPDSLARPNETAVEWICRVHPHTCAEEQADGTEQGDESFGIGADMLISADQKRHYDRSGLSGLVQLGSKVMTDSFLWPGGQVKYRFAAGFPYATQCTTAMRNMEALFCLRFTEATSSDSSYIDFTRSSSGCFSYVGYGRGARQLNLGSDGCAGIGTIMHEIGHAVGLLHEQSRHDRDQYVTVHMNRIQGGKANNFDKSTSNSNGEITTGTVRLLIDS